MDITLQTIFALLAVTTFAVFLTKLCFECYNKGVRDAMDNMREMNLNFDIIVDSKNIICEINFTKPRTSQKDTQEEKTKEGLRK